MMHVLIDTDYLYICQVVYYIIILSKLMYKFVKIINIINIIIVYMHTQTCLVKPLS